MASSGTYTFDINVQECITEAYERAGVDAQILTGYQVRAARRSLNLLFADWATRGVNYWKTEETTLALVQGTLVYALPTGTTDILSAVLRRAGSDTVLQRISLTDYNVKPNKTDQGKPTAFFFDRQITPQLYLWQVPENSTDTIVYWVLRQVEDITASNESADVPYRWYEAMCSGLAYKLATKSPTIDVNRIALLTTQMDVAFDHVAQDEAERASLSIIPTSVI